MAESTSRELPPERGPLLDRRWYQAVIRGSDHHIKINKVSRSDKCSLGHLKHLRPSVDRGDRDRWSGHQRDRDLTRLPPRKFFARPVDSPLPFFEPVVEVQDATQGRNDGGCRGDH